MFSNLRAYDEYRETPVPWLPHVPSLWRLERMKALFFERTEKGHPDLPLLAATQSHGVIRKSSYENRTVTATKDLHLLKLVEVGDFVISLRSFQGGIERSYSRGIISPAYTVLRTALDLYRDYASFLFKSQPFVGSLALAVTGIREGQNIDYSRLCVEALPVPPADDQVAIVRYLRHADARISSAVASKRRLIALLQEQRAVVIRQTVLGAQACRQFASGVPWLGDIPVGWSAVRVKQVISGMEQGWSPQCDAQPADPTEWGVLKVGCSNYGTFRPDQNKRLSIGLEPREWLEVQHGDVLVSRANTRQLVGSAAVALNPPRRLIFSDKTFRLHERTDLIDGEFLALALGTPSARDQIEAGAVGASHSMQNIGQDVLTGLWLALPPLDDQRGIVARVRSTAAESDRSIERVETEIDLLMEFRDRLVADVVTGQIDVRKIAGSLSEIDVASTPYVPDQLPDIDPAEINELLDASEV